MLVSKCRIIAFQKVFGDVTEAEARIGTLLMKQAQLLLTNDHGILEQIETKGHYSSREGFFKKHVEEFIIGRGFYPLLTRIKHSCDPNVTAISYGNTLVIYAVQPIAAGEPVRIIGQQCKFRIRIVGLQNCPNFGSVVETSM